MDILPVLFVFCLLFLAVSGLGGVYLFQYPKRKAKAQARKEATEIKEFIPLTDLDLQAHALMGMLTQIEDTAEAGGKVTLFRARVGSLPKLAPRSAITKAWRELERAGIETLALYDYGDFPVTRISSLQMLKLLSDNAILSSDEYEMCEAIDHIRAKISGLPNSRVGEPVARSVVDAVDRMMRTMQAFQDSVAARNQDDAPEPGGTA